MLLSLLFLFVFFPRDGVYGFGRGAPGDVEKTKDVVCKELMPLHYNMSFQDPHTNPFYVKLTSLTDMSSVEVALKVSEVQEDVLIMGFLVQGRSEKGEIIGTFDTSLTENITLTCQNTTISQYKKQWKKEIVLTWLAPEGFQGKVIFHVVVLKNTSEFWRFEAEHPHIITRTCKKGAGCFRCPENSCMVQWTPSDDVVKFDVEATHEIMVYSYIAIGLSHDMKMGDDSITECFIDGKGEQIVRMSWNEGNINQQLSEPMSSIVPGSTSVSLADGVLRCTFTRYLRSTSRDNEITSRKVYYPGDSEYYLLVAIGDVDPDGNLEMHHQRFHSLEKINFNRTDITIHPSVDYGKYLIKAHGTMMVVSWLLLASFASILPRYFKKKLQGVKIFKKPFWFALHQSIMLVVAGLTITSFILIFAKVGGYAALEFPGSVHPPLGILVTILVLLNPIMALFRCDSGSNKRWIFDLFHFFVGQSVLIIAVITIFLSVSIKSSGLESPMIGLLSFHVCWHILIELMLTAHDKHVTSLTKSAIQSADILMKHEKEITISDSGSVYASPRVPSVIVLVYLIVSIANTLVVAVMIWRA